MRVLRGAILLSFGALIIAGANDFRSDYVYHSAAQGWFKLHKTPANWQDARIRCSLEGAVLASPINIDISDVMHSIIDKAGPCCSPIHTGFHDTIASTQYDSIEGVPLATAPGVKCEMFPKGYTGGPSCMRLAPKEGLVAGSCSDALPYLCYKKKTAELVVTECGTTDRAYHYDNRTGHCYKFHRYTLTWPLAYLTCAAEGGYLAVVNSAVESTVLVQLAAQNPPEVVLGPGPGRNNIYLGFNDWNESGFWRTIQGQTLEEAGFALWGPGQPDNVKRPSDGLGTYCGTMFRSGELDDRWCDDSFAYICEKDPNTLRPLPEQCPVIW